jgi:hypothetical protein
MLEDRHARAVHPGAIDDAAASFSSATSDPMVPPMNISHLRSAPSLSVFCFALALLAPVSSAQAPAQRGSSHSAQSTPHRSSPPRASADRAGFQSALTGPTCTPDWIPTFGGSGSPNGDVQALLEFDDGSGPALYVAGLFTSVGNLTVNHIARWKGGVWSALGSGLDDWCLALGAFDDGSGPALYAAGYFLNAGGQPAAGVAKWNGSSWSALGTGLSGSFIGPDSVGVALHAFDDGSGPALFVGGNFTSAGGVTSNGIARWNGATWSALGSGLDSGVGALEVFDDGSGAALYVGGDFTHADGMSASRIARWNGSAWSALGSGITGTNAYVGAMTVYSVAGVPALYAGGFFASAGGVASGGLARWDGAQWHAAGDAIMGNSPEDFSPGAIYALKVFDAGSGPTLYAGGRFTYLDGTHASRIAKTTGGLWQALSSGADQDVYALETHDNGWGEALYVGGHFGGAGGVATGTLARWTGTTWSSLFFGVTGCRAIATFDDGSGAGAALYLAGGVVPAPGGDVAQVARWSGSSWTSLTPGVTGPAGVWSMVAFDDGSGPALYAGGGFTTIDGVSASHIAKWNGTAWAPMGAGINGWVYTLRVLDDGTGPALYAGGDFTLAGSTPASCIAKWNGSSWSALGSGTSARVWDITTFDEGSGRRIFAAGEFANAGGGSVSFVARWDGSAWSALGGGLNGFANALAVFDDGSGPALYAGGSFTTAGAPPVQAKFVARWNGSAWSALGPGINGPVESLAVFDDGSGARLCAGGTFTSAGGMQANVKCWNGAAWSLLGGGLPSTVHVVRELEPSTGAGLYVGGEFGSSPSNDAHLARWGCPGAVGVSFCYGDGTQATPCPCANTGAPFKGCENSAATGGARLAAIGAAHPDSIVLTSSGELASVLSIFLQGNTDLSSGVSFGDGLRCVGGALKRLYVKNASGGIVSAPGSGDLSISARSAQLGDPISLGTTRSYQVYYRDPNLAFCPAPAGNSWNVSSAIRIAW